MHLCVRRLPSGLKVPAIVVHDDSVCDCDQPQRIPSQVIETCGVLSSLLETSGCALLPSQFTVAQAQAWLFLTQNLSYLHSLSSEDLHVTSQVCSQIQRAFELLFDSEGVSSCFVHSS
jgi:hypothetical protein